ncbi:unnamed protein product [Closterium sp. NIES-65]|nr:unnamed protein product [Closterium sp. NIES-65]
MWLPPCFPKHERPSCCPHLSPHPRLTCSHNPDSLRASPLVTNAPVADPCGGACKGNRECVQGACTCKEGYTEMDGACTGELKKKGLEVAHGCSAVLQRPMPHSHLTLSSLFTLTSLSPHSLLTLTSLSPNSHSVTSLSPSPVSVHSSNVPVADPYGGTCGETRECVQGVFECKAGYTEIDGACTGMNAPVADPCDGIVCEGDREYVPTNGQGVCECMAGYTEIDGVCTDVPPNVPLAPLIPPTRPVTAVCSPACSLYASCQVANGTAVCECDAGYTMLDNGECTRECLGVKWPGVKQYPLLTSCLSSHSASSPPSCPLPVPQNPDPLVPLVAVCNPACKAKAGCVVVGGDSVCRCKQGYVLKKKRCMRRGGLARRWGG